ncbi:hypothetical protein KKC_05542 [Listeria fleischmannii subsp. coloradonensis]|nr:hypothetical protein KKC_05542 [Listeria fleischmannii subsp. coloradonensis]
METISATKWSLSDKVLLGVSACALSLFGALIATGYSFLEEGIRLININHFF